tara:strand:- start:1169 stop:2098 length:930 start_codon:yes stop_codon:yes gene_type:complete
LEAFKDKIIPVIFGLKGYSLTKKEMSIIKNNMVFGFILFKRNILNFTQLRALIDHLKKLSLNDPIIMIDHEGGRVNRFSNIFSQQTFTAKYFGELFSEDKKKFLKVAKFFVNLNSGIFNFLGINTVAYPVLDLKYNKTHEVIGDRSFSSDPYIVKKISRVFIREYQKKGINCISKHVPGHGLSIVDSHYDLPVIKESYNYLTKNDFSCFKNIKSKFMMTAHINFSSIDKKIATYSKKINLIIKNELNFKGLIMTDDICMMALRENLVYRTLQPLIAGYDIILHCNGNINEMEKIVSIIKKWKNQKKQKI